MYEKETLEIIQLNLLASQVISFFPLYINHSYYQFIYLVSGCKMGNSKASRVNPTIVQKKESLLPAEKCNTSRGAAQLKKK